MATRIPDLDMDGLPTLEVGGSGRTRCPGVTGQGVDRPLDERIRDQIIAETGGNPLALMELPRDLTDGDLAGGFGMPSALRLSGRIEELPRRLAALPEKTTTLLPTATPTDR